MRKRVKNMSMRPFCNCQILWRYKVNRNKSEHIYVDTENTKEMATKLHQSVGFRNSSIVRSRKSSVLTENVASEMRNLSDFITHVCCGRTTVGWRLEYILPFIYFPNLLFDLELPLELVVALLNYMAEKQLKVDDMW